MQTITISTPENLIVSQNGNQPQQPSSEVEKLLQGNTSLAVWLIFLAIGGGLLARYYVKIGYLPEMEWNAALVYLFVCSVWGSVIGLVLTMSLYLPGVIWSEIIVFEDTQDGHLTYCPDDPSCKHSERKEPCIRSITRYLGIPFAVVLLASHLCLRFSNPGMDFYWVLAALILVPTFFYFRGKFRDRLIPKEEPKDKDEIDKRQTLGRQIFRYCIWLTLSVLLTQIATYLVYLLTDRVLAWDKFILLTLICTAGGWLSTTVVAVRHRYYPRQALVAALVIAVVLLFWVDRFSDLSMKLMSRYGVGEYKKYNLLVTPDAIPLLKSEDVPTCGPQHLCNVEILSKMGDHYFLKVGDKDYLTLPKKDVIAIRRL